MNYDNFMALLAQARTRNPDLTITATFKGDHILIESFDTNGLRWRHRTFEPHFEETFRKDYRI